LKNKIPNLFLVGAPKSGTTAIYEFLNSHPDIFMSPIKEPHFFSKDIKPENFTPSYRLRHKFNLKKYLNSKDFNPMHIAYLSNESLEDYLKLFENHRDQKLLGEASTGYLYSECAAKEIHKFNPNAKIIMCLRNPIDRAFSHWKMDYRAGRSKSSTFVSDVNADYSMNDHNWGGKSQTLVQIGKYANQVERYFQLFDHRNIKCLIYEDLKTNPKSTMDDLFNFLNVNNDIDIDFNKKHNPSITPKSSIVKFLFNYFRSNFHLRDRIPGPLKILIKKLFFTQNDKDMILKSDYEQLSHYFKDDILSLESLLNVDLSKWKKEF
tara:strand:- start:17220 stop:18182 length:963 start_codon:yes stop_codon:yes gene_type:complete